MAKDSPYPNPRRSGLERAGTNVAGLRGGLKAHGLGPVPAVPDSTILHADATQLSLSDTDSVDPWTDESGSGNDLTAGDAPTFRTGKINGNDVVRFNGSTNYLDVAFGTESQPNTLLIVLDPSAGGAGQHVFDSEDGTSNRNALDTNSNDEWVAFAGSSIIGGSNAQSPTLISIIFNGASTVLRQDGTQIASGDAGTQGLDGITLGSRHDQSSHFAGDVGEALGCTADLSATGELSGEEQRMADKWGIAL